MTAVVSVGPPDVPALGDVVVVVVGGFRCRLDEDEEEV